MYGLEKTTCSSALCASQKKQANNLQQPRQRIHDLRPDIWPLQPGDCVGCCNGRSLPPNSTQVRFVLTAVAFAEAWPLPFGDV